MKYIANQSVGQFKTGDEVTGLSDERAKELLAIGAIHAVESEPNEPAKTKPKGKKDTDKGEPNEPTVESEPNEPAKS